LSSFGPPRHCSKCRQLPHLRPPPMRAPDGPYGERSRTGKRRARFDRRDVRRAFVFAAAACAACSPSGGAEGVRDADVEVGVETDIGTVEGGASMDVSTTGIDAHGDEAIDETDGGARDVAIEASACADVFGPVYVPDADD